MVRAPALAGHSAFGADVALSGRSAFRVGNFAQFKESEIKLQIKLRENIEK